MTEPPTARTKIELNTSAIVVLLALSLFINYIDRGNLSIAAPLLKNELSLSASQLGILLSSFFWTYAIFQVVSGWLVDRCDVNWVMAVGFFLWSAATAITGVVHGYAALIAVRLLLGIGESTAFPSYSKILARHVSEVHRGFANACIIAGMGCGPAFGTFAGGMLMARFGWRPFFIILGLVSMLWLVPWLKWMPREHSAVQSASKRPPAMSEVLRQRSAWGSCVGLLCGNYTLYFLLTWLPFYLVHERNLSMQRMARVGGLAYLLIAVSAVISGRISDLWIAAGGTPTAVRKTFAAGGTAAAGGFLLACAWSGPTIALPMLMLASISFGMFSSNLWAITQTLAGPLAAGRWTGFQNFIGNFAGILAPAITGFVVERTGHFFVAFAITAAVALLGALAWIFVVGPVRQVQWSQDEIQLDKTIPESAGPRRQSAKLL